MTHVRQILIAFALSCATVLGAAACSPSATVAAPESVPSSQAVVDDVANKVANAAAQARAEEEAAKKAEEEAAARKAAEEAAKKKAEQEAAAKKKAAEEEAAKKKAEEETAKKAAEEEAARKAAEEEAARDAAEEEAARQAAEQEAQAQQQAQQATLASGSASEFFASMDIVEDYRASFVHGSKPADVQRYIMLHDTESESSPESVVSYWDGNGAGVAAHFVVGRDGHVVQCVGLDQIAHHAGFGYTGHNAAYGVEDESRDDKVGTVPIGDWASDYGMNSYSIGIEMVHVGGGAPYTEEQLAAVDKVIAYIDAYYGFQSAIIDHKAWRSGNSDTSPEFAGYLANYQATRHH